MATLFRNRAGVDWDDLFEPEVGGNGVGDPKYRRSDDSIIRYARRALGTAVPSVEAGRTDGGGDVTTLWAKKGSVAYLNTDTNGALTFQGISVGAWASGVTFADHLISKFSMHIYNDGRWELYLMTTNFKDDNVWQYGVGASTDRGDNNTTPVLVSAGTWAKNVGAGVGSSYLVDAYLVGEAGDGSVVRSGWRDYYSSNTSLYADHYPGFRGSGTVNVNGGVGLGSNISLASSRVFEFSLDVLGNSNNYGLRDYNAGLAWFNRSRLYITIKNAASPTIAATGGMLFVNLIRWNPSTWPTISRTSGGGGGGGGGGVGGGGCPVVESIMYDGATAGEYDASRALLVTDPYLTENNSTTGEVISSTPSMQPCVQVICADGTVFECSTTAPIPTKDMGFLVAPALLGQLIPTAAAEDLDGENTPFDWSEVVEVKDIGERMVQKLFVQNRCFWISKDGKRFGLHHNLKQVGEIP